MQSNCAQFFLMLSLSLTGRIAKFTKKKKIYLYWDSILFQFTF